MEVPVVGTNDVSSLVRAVFTATVDLSITTGNGSGTTKDVCRAFLYDEGDQSFRLSHWLVGGARCKDFTLSIIEDEDVGGAAALPHTSRRGRCTLPY